MPDGLFHDLKFFLNLFRNPVMKDLLIADLNLRGGYRVVGPNDKNDNFHFVKNEMYDMS